MVLVFGEKVTMMDVAKCIRNVMLIFTKFYFVC